MPNISAGSQLAVSYVQETVAGVTPATPQLIKLPVANMDIKKDQTFLSDNSRTGDNQQKFLSAGSYQTNGSLEVNLSHSQFDDMLQAALMGTWTANVLKVGNVRRSFTFEEFDSALAKTRLFTGVEVGGVKLSIKPKELVTANFDLIGRGYSVGTVTLDTTPTEVIAGKNPFTGGYGSLTIDGVAGFVTSLDLSITNAIKMINTIGSLAATASINSMKEISGSFSVLFTADEAISSKFLANQTVTLSFVLSDGTNSYTFNIPRCSLKSASPSTANEERVLACEFVCLKDDTLGAIMSITRT